MSTAKRRSRHQDAKTVPAAKRVKVSKISHVPARPQGLEFLVDEDARDGRRLEARMTNGGSKGMQVDESRAGIAPDARDGSELGGSQKNAIDISSAEEESGDEEVDEEDDGHPVNGANYERPLTNGHTKEAEDDDANEQAATGAEDLEMADHNGTADEEQIEDGRQEPSFGDLLLARHPDPIDVRAAFPDPTFAHNALASTSNQTALSTIPTGTTLRTVLTQALRTNDRSLLESCFQTTDLPSIRLTIERLPSHLIATLLQRLAERIYKRPGRTGNLVTWVQWSLVAHGAYLASQPEVMKQVRGLVQVLRERATGLGPLLRLKGKLDMLQAQLEVRQRVQGESRVANGEDGDEEEGVVYVEGIDEEWNDGLSEVEEDVEVGMVVGASRMKGTGQIAPPQSDGEDSGDESDSEADMPNGVAQEGVEDESDGEEDEQNGLLDIEAEETSDDDDAEEDADSDAESRGASDDDEVTEPSGDESEGGVKEPKPQTLSRKR